MKKQQKRKDVVPVDIRAIRQRLGVSLKEVGLYVAVTEHGSCRSPIPETRISEWESGWRSVPDYVYTASVKLLLDYWSDDRHMTPECRQLEVDAFYGLVLNPTLGELFKLELALSRSRNPKVRGVVKDVKAIRKAHIKYLEAVLNVDMSYVFDPELGPPVALPRNAA